MLQNAYFLAKIGADTAENERKFAEILPNIGNYPTGPPGRRDEAVAKLQRPDATQGNDAHHLGRCGNSE